MFTARLEVKYRKNVPMGKRLHIVGKAGKSTGKTAESWVGIYDGETNELLAEGRTLLIDVPDEKFNSSRLDELGWKIYPDRMAMNWIATRVDTLSFATNTQSPIPSCIMMPLGIYSFAGVRMITTYYRPKNIQEALTV